MMRASTIVKFGIAGLLLGLVLPLGKCTEARAQSFGYAQPGRGFLITPGVPTVPGIRPAPIGGYDRPEAAEAPRPRAVILPLWEPAPANGCPSPAFRVISGPKAQRGCYGGP